MSNVEVIKSEPQNSNNVGNTFGKILISIVIFISVITLLNVYQNAKREAGKPVGCYRAINKNGGLSDFELCFKSDSSVTYNYVIVNRDLSTEDMTKKLYFEWYNSSGSIFIRDSYNNIWLNCDLSTEDSRSMQCESSGRDGTGIGTVTMWEKQ